MVSGIISITFIAGALIYLSFALILAITDYQTGLLPDRLTLPLLWLGLLFHTLVHPGKSENAIYGAVFGYLSLWLVYWGFFWITRREGLGYGDVKLLAAIGAWNGWQSLPLVLIIASVTGVITLAGLYVIQQKKVEQLPFGPYLALAGWGEFIWPI